MKTIKEKLYDLGYFSDSQMERVFMPEGMDKAFVGLAETDWHYGRPVYDESKLDMIPEIPEDVIQPIFFTPGFNEDEVEDVIVFDPQEGLNKAIVGITDGNQAVYEYTELLEAMMETENWDEEEAADWISYNTLRDYSYRDRGPVVYSDIREFLED